MNIVIVNINLFTFNLKITSQNGLFLKYAILSIKKIFFANLFGIKKFYFNLLSNKIFFKRNIEKANFLIFFCQYQIKFPQKHYFLVFFKNSYNKRKKNINCQFQASKKVKFFSKVVKKGFFQYVLSSLLQKHNLLYVKCYLYLIISKICKKKF